MLLPDDDDADDDDHHNDYDHDDDDDIDDNCENDIMQIMMIDDDAFDDYSCPSDMAIALPITSLPILQPRTLC